MKKLVSIGLILLCWTGVILGTASAVTNHVSQTNFPAAQKLIARAGDRSVALHWECPEPAARFQVYRAQTSATNFTKISADLASPRFADLNVTNDETYFYRVHVLHHGNETAVSEIISATPKAFANDREFLRLLQQTAFDFFWREANPKNGLVRDRTRANSPCSIAAVGFGLTALGIGVERGWISREQGAQRTFVTLKTFWEKPQGTNATGVIGHRGWFYHFLDMDSATRHGQCELSSIDTALFLAGALYAKTFFDGDNAVEKEIRALAGKIFARVDWNWMAQGKPSLTMGWKPEDGFIQARWIGYNEAMILYLLGLGAEKNPLTPAHWKTWTSGYRWRTHYGQSFVEFPPLFGHQYSHCWIDFRGVADDFLRAKKISYFENSRRATLAQREYAIANPGGFKGYGANVWGITACDGPGRDGREGYAGRGAPPPLFDDGTIAPTAAGSAIVFAPEISLSALRHFYEMFRTNIWTAYGFCDAFNLDVDWWDDEVLGIDQGPMLLMIENYLSESVWRTFMKTPEIERGLRRAGFQRLGSADGR